MGIIKRQAIHSSIYVYIGVGVGFLNAALLFPQLISPEQIGLLSLLNSLTTIFASVFTLGAPLITIRLFPRFRNPQENNDGFFSFLLGISILGCVLGIGSFYLLQDVLISDKNSARDFAPFFAAFWVLFSFRLIGRNFDTLIRMLYNTVIGAFTENFLLKFIVSIALGIYWLLEGFDFLYLFIIYTAALSIPGVISIVYLLKSGEWRFQPKKFLNNVHADRKEFFSLGLFGILGSVGSIIVLEVDRVMISNMIGLTENGIYTTAYFFGIFLSVPSRGIRRVASVVSAEAWKNNDLQTIQDIYYKSALNQFLFGAYLFLGVWLNVDYVFQFIPPAFEAGKYVILFIGLGQLIEMATGVNAEIIASSKYYRYNTYSSGALIFLTVGFNYYFIPRWGITGAAIASGISVVIINVARYIFLFQKFRFQAFQPKMAINVLLGVGCFLLIYFFIPKMSNPLLGILVTGSFLTVVYWVTAYALKLSEDVNQTIESIVNKIFKRD